MAVSVETFLTRYPEFKGVDKARIKTVLADAAPQISAKQWGNLYEQGVCALAAHFLALSGADDVDGQGSGQPALSVSGMSADGLSISYGSGNAGLSGEFGTYDSTSYGQRYLELRRLTAKHVLVTGAGCTRNFSGWRSY